MVIEELLPVGAITLLSGQPYSGKTFVALEIARAVATGEPFMGKWNVDQPGNVLIVEQDSPKYDTGRALWAMVAEQYQNESEAAREALGASILDGIRIAWHPGLDLKSAADAMRIIETANGMYTWRGEGDFVDFSVDPDGNITQSEVNVDFGYKGARVIILDSARSLHRGKENESDDMEKVLQNIKQIRERTGAAIVLIAHDNASGEKTRGSTAIPAGVDSEYAVVKRKKKGDVGVYIRKARAIAPQEFRFTIRTTEESYGVVKRVAFKEYIDIETDEDEPGTEDKRAVLMAFIAEGTRDLGTEIKQWGEENDVAERTIKRWLSDAVGTGYLIQTYRNEGRSRRASYSVKGGK